MELFKSPGVAETIDWTAALIALDQHELTETVIQDTVGVILKYQDDIESVNRASIQSILDRAKLQADAAR